MRGTLRARLEAFLLPLLTVMLVLGIWHEAVKASGTTIFPSPAAVVRAMRELTERGLLVPYILDSLLRVGTGFVAAVVLSVPLGCLLGRSPRAATAINPAIQLMRPISPLAWIPLSIVFFGVSNLATIFLVFLASFFPLVTVTMNAVQAIPPIFLRAGHNFGLSTAQVWRRVILPAALPQVLVGLRLTFGIAWLVLVAAEMIAVDSGLGYLILDARNAGKRYDLVVAGMLLIGVLGVTLDILIRRVERLRPVRWGFRED
jgi:NitT/TauT family transport system permease protein